MSISPPPLQDDVIVCPEPNAPHAELMLSWVPAWMMTADHPFQRKSTGKRVEDMSVKWNDDLLGAISLIEIPLRMRQSGSNVRYWIVEGGHRHASAVKRFGMSFYLPCTIIAFKDIQHVGLVFLGMNGERRAVGRFDEYRVGSNSGLEPYVSINRILDSCGLSYGPNQTDTTIGATKMLVQIYEEFGPDVLRETISLINQVWPGDPKRWSSPMLRGISDLIGLNQREGIEIDYARLTEKLLRMNPQQWINLGISLVTSGGGSTSRGSSVGRAIIREYNKGTHGRPFRDRLVHRSDRRVVDADTRPVKRRGAKSVVRLSSNHHVEGN